MKEGKRKREKEKKLIYLALFLLMFFPVSAMADSVTITNSVTSHASSGGNVSTGGVVVESNTTHSVSVKTVINGEVVEDHTETSDQPIHYEKTVVRGESTSTVVTRTDADAPSSTARQENTIPTNATHARAPESTPQSGDSQSSAEQYGIHRADATAAHAVADVVYAGLATPQPSAEAGPATSGALAAADIATQKPLAEAGVATRVFMNMRSILIKVIHFLSW